MSKFFYDTEFLEGTQTKRILGMQLKFFIILTAFVLAVTSLVLFYFKHEEVGITLAFASLALNFVFWTMKEQTLPTIDLISIGIVSDDGREFYAISKDFNLKEAWERYDLKPDIKEGGFKKVYWIRENVLSQIFMDLLVLEDVYGYERNLWSFTYKNLKRLLNKHGKTNAEIAKEVKEFCLQKEYVFPDFRNYTPNTETGLVVNKPELYGYYSAYDHVALCWLFGKMIDLPKGFPMYTIDLQQMLDEKIEKLPWLYLRDTWNNSRMSVYTIGKGDSQEKDRPATFEEKLKRVKELEEYPKQTNEHNALWDASWNRDLHNFIKSL